MACTVQCWQSAATSESKRVLEREYGGFLPVFGEGHSPDASQVTTGLGSRWITTEIAVKHDASMALVDAGDYEALAIRAKKQIVPDQRCCLF